MKSRKIFSAILAAALMTSTVVYAEGNIEYIVENEKGTYTFTDEQLEAYNSYFCEENGYNSANGADSGNVVSTIIDNNSTISVTTSGDFNLNYIYRVDFELINIEMDTNGNTSFEQLYTLWNGALPPAIGPIWGPYGGGFIDTTLSASVLYEKINTFCDKHELGEETILNYYYDPADVDMVLVRFHTDNQLDDDGYAKNPWTYDSETGKQVVKEGHAPNVKLFPLLTEQGADKLSKANSTTSPDDTTKDDPVSDTSTENGNTSDSSNNNGSADSAASSDSEGNTGNENKGSADTGIESAAVFGGIAAIAGAAVLLSRKRK